MVKRIASATVLLLNAAAVGAEVLKNIVLPGFGKFTIVDHKKVTNRDLGKNFYVTSDSLGKSRAETVRNNLAELNPDDVKGDYLEENPITVIEEHPEFFDNYNFIITANLNTGALLKLSKICWKKNKTLLACRSYGMIGYIRIIVQSHEVYEGKLDTPVEDLRLTHPFPELQKFVDKHEFEKMDFKTHCHTPYIVILIKFLEKFKKKI